MMMRLVSFEFFGHICIKQRHDSRYCICLDISLKLLVLEKCAVHILPINLTHFDVVVALETRVEQRFETRIGKGKLAL